MANKRPQRSLGAEEFRRKRRDLSAQGRDAGELFDAGSTYRDSYDRCTPFVNDAALEHGSDVSLSG